jgi:hypothetical protein
VFLRLRINKGIKEKEQIIQIGKKEREKMWKSITKKKNERGVRPLAKTHFV